MIPLTRRSTEEAYAVRSAGGKAAQGIGWRGTRIMCKTRPSFIPASIHMRIQIKPQKTIDVFCQICYPVYADCAATAKVLKRRKNSMTDKLQEYAQLLINVGLNVQKDQ